MSEAAGPGADSIPVPGLPPSAGLARPRRVVSRTWRRLVRVQRMRGQRGILFLAGGALIGVAGVGMAIGASAAEVQFDRLLALWSYASLVVTPVGFALLAWITRRFVTNSEGSGIPQAIAARKLWDQAARGKLVSLRIGFGKIVLTLAGLLCGASIGREGPTVQVGASIMFAIGRLSPARQPGLILAGAAAGIAAAFNTPLAGVVFAIEEMSRAFDERSNGLVIGAIVAAGIVSTALLGNYTYFGVTASDLGGGIGWLGVPLCGVVGGLLGGAFARALVVVARGLPGKFGAACKAHPVVFAFGCGLLVAICGVLSGNTIFGTGYRHIKAVIDHGGPLSLSFGPLKLIATILSSIAGIPGGLFSPSLAVGGGIGFDIARLLPGAPVDALVILGMVGYFSGVVQAPITAFAIVAEMTADHNMIVPLMATSMIGTVSSRLVCPEGVYHILSRNYYHRYAPTTVATVAGGGVGGPGDSGDDSARDSKA
ncbi:MAG TPA: chloride channel protein [Acetobacteraceae bacterium]|nr:chloride channel protein [Acetobacteraceae bacterium]